MSNRYTRSPGARRDPGSLLYRDCVFARSDPASRPPAALVLQPALDHIVVYLPGAPLANDPLTCGGAFSLLSRSSPRSLRKSGPPRDPILAAVCAVRHVKSGDPFNWASR